MSVTALVVLVILICFATFQKFQASWWWEETPTIQPPEEMQLEIPQAPDEMKWWDDIPTTDNFHWQLPKPIVKINRAVNTGYSIIDSDDNHYDAVLYTSDRASNTPIIRIPSFLSATETGQILQRANSGERQWMPNYSRTGTRQSRNNFLNMNILRRIGALFHSFHFTCSGIVQYRYLNAVGLHSDGGEQTILLYLDDVPSDAGGATCFPSFHVNGSTCFQPEQGTLLLWGNDRDTTCMEHEGIAISKVNVTKHVIACQTLHRWRQFEYRESPFYKTQIFGGGNV